MRLIVYSCAQLPHSIPIWRKITLATARKNNHTKFSRFFFWLMENFFVDGNHCQMILERLFSQRSCGINCDASLQAKNGEIIYYHSMVLEGKNSTVWMLTFYYHAVGLDLWVKTAIKSISRITLSLKQLNIFLIVTLKFILTLIFNQFRHGGTNVPPSFDFQNSSIFKKSPIFKKLFHIESGWFRSRDWKS